MYFLLKILKDFRKKMGKIGRGWLTQQILHVAVNFSAKKWAN